MDGFAYQKRQLLGHRRQEPCDRAGFRETVELSRNMPPMGSRVPSGCFPHSFDYSSGLTLQDPYYTHGLSTLGDSKTASAPSSEGVAGGPTLLQAAASESSLPTEKGMRFERNFVSERSSGSRSRRQPALQLQV